MLTSALAGGHLTARLAALRVFLLLVAGWLAPLSAAALEQVPEFGENPGQLDMYLHLPARFEASLPLVVALHGCRQTAADFDDETGLLALAEETPFVLLLPQQRAGNMNLNCFRWYDPDDNRPGLGESASIRAMIDAAIDRYDLDPGRVFVLGLSAGGAMTSVLLANYPERFAGGAIIAATPFDCNRPTGWFDWYWYWLNMNPFVVDGADASYACGIRGSSTTDRSAAEWGGYVRSVAGSAPPAWPPVSIWQGDRDATVDPDNLAELVEQWTDVHGIDAEADTSETLGRATRKVYTDAAGNALVEAWSIGDFPHAVPIDADGEPATCGVQADYMADAGLCAVRRIADFWQLAR